MGDHICPWWLAYTFDNPFRHFFHNPEKMLGSYVAKGMTVLDVGCGMGFFSIGLAKLVGDKGCVIASDVQPEMLSTLEKRAEKAGCSDRICIHRSELNKLGVETTVDFILAFWMVHEVPDTSIFFRQICSCLKPNGRILIAEPKFHVSLKRFQEILVSAQESGLNLCETPCLRFSRSAVLKNDSLQGFSEESCLLSIINRLANGIAKTKFASRAINDGADLSAFKEKLTVQNYFGIVLMCCSYIIGWPAVVLIGALSIHWHESLLIIIGGPLLLVIAHLVFLAGMYLAGGKYIMVFFRWATRVTLEKLM